MEAWNDQIQGLFLKETTTLVYSLNSSHHAVTLPVNQLWCIAIFTEQHIVYTHTVVHSHDALRTLPAVNTFCTHVAHSFFVVLSMNGQCVFSSPALWRWKATWPFYQPLVETFDNTVTTWARTHTRPDISISNILFRVLLALPALAGALFKHIQRQTHK